MEKDKKIENNKSWWTNWIRYHLSSDRKQAPPSRGDYQCFDHIQIQNLCCYQWGIMCQPCANQDRNQSLPRTRNKQTNKNNIKPVKQKSKTEIRVSVKIRFWCCVGFIIWEARRVMPGPKRPIRCTAWENLWLQKVSPFGYLDETLRRVKV